MKWLMKQNGVSPAISNLADGNKSLVVDNSAARKGNTNTAQVNGSRTTDKRNSKFVKLRKLASEIEDIDNVSQLEEDGKKASVPAMVDRDAFPLFDDEHFAKYVRFNNRHAKIMPEMPFYVISFVKVATRLNLAYVGQRGPHGTAQSEALFYISLVLLIVALLLAPLRLIPRHGMLRAVARVMYRRLLGPA